MAGRIGISTACFYPLETEKSLRRICERGVKSCEIFLNTVSELEDSFIKGISRLLTDNEVYVTSLHPFASFAESYALFSSYKRRFYDSLELLKRYFEVMNTFGAKVLVIHGGKYSLSIPKEEYFERFGEIALIGKASGLITAQENVVHYLSESPDFMFEMSDALGDLFNMVLDIKQSLRAGVSPVEFISRVGEDIAHVHLSDHNTQHDCIAPLLGEYDFASLFDKLGDIGYKGDYTLELYSSSYESEDEIFDSCDKLRHLYEKRLENRLD
ncbi:MAG: Xylose isomerase-like TIM barrel [Firmicutes bacterium ADurb.Bin300]|nr:MAG: Xylose isomerase-like TIM barrel [Firmicutes bacterium ADurb.Bin300]